MGVKTLNLICSQWGSDTIAEVYPMTENDTCVYNNIDLENNFYDQNNLISETDEGRRFLDIFNSLEESHNQPIQETGSRF